MSFVEEQNHSSPFWKRKAPWPHLRPPRSCLLLRQEGIGAEKGWCSSGTDCEGRPGPVRLSWALGLVIYHCQTGGKRHWTVPARLLTDSWLKLNATSGQIICHQGGTCTSEILYHRLHAASCSKLLTSSQGRKEMSESCFKGPRCILMLR